MAAAHCRLAQQTEAKITALQTAVAYHSTQAAALDIPIKKMGDAARLDLDGTAGRRGDSIGGWPRRHTHRAGRAVTPDSARMASMSWPDTNEQFRRGWGSLPRPRLGTREPRLEPPPRERPVLVCRDPAILNRRAVRHPFGPSWFAPNTRKPGLKNRQAGGSI